MNDKVMRVITAITIGLTGLAISAVAGIGTMVAEWGTGTAAIPGAMMGLLMAGLIGIVTGTHLDRIVVYVLGLEKTECYACGEESIDR